MESFCAAVKTGKVCITGIMRGRRVQFDVLCPVWPDGEQVDQTGSPTLTWGVPPSDPIIYLSFYIAQLVTSNRYTLQFSHMLTEWCQVI